MKKFPQTLFVSTLVAFALCTLAVAAGSPDAVVGTWTLNLAKSKYSAGHAPKSQTRTYSESADGISMSVEGVAADGSPMTQKCTYKYDGKDYAFTGADYFDMLSLERVDANNVKSTQKKDGKAVGTTVRNTSANGKVLTLTSKGTDAKGVAFEDVAVFDRK